MRGVHRLETIPVNCCVSEAHEAVRVQWDFGTTRPLASFALQQVADSSYPFLFSEQLFDLNSDPGETRNLSLDSNWREELEEHRTLLHHGVWIRMTRSYIRSNE